MRLNSVKLLALSMVIVLGFMVRIVCFVGLIGSDDLTYNHRAYEMMTGTFAPQPEHQASRVGLFLPVAGIFRLFGINEVSSVIFPFVCGLVTFGLVLWMGITCLGWWTGLMAGCLYALLPIDMFQATMLLPDLPAATCVAASAILIFRNVSEDSGKHAGSRMFLAGILLGWAYLIKETSVFFGVFVVGYAGYYWWRHKRLFRGWGWFAAGVFIPVIAEFGYYSWTTGMPFFRYVAVQTDHNNSLFSGRHYQGLNLVRRLTLDTFFILFRVTDFSLLYVFVLAGCVYSIWTRNACIRFLAGWLGGLLLLYNFASTSLSGYYPLMLFHRFFLTISVPAVLICAWFLREISQVLLADHRRNMLRLRISLGIPMIPLLAVDIIRFSWLKTTALCVLVGLIAVTYIIAFRQWLRRHRVFGEKRIVVSGTLLLLLLLPGIVLSSSGERLRKGLTCEREIVPILGDQLRHPVYTDERTVSILEFFYQYQHKDLLVAFHDFDLATVENVYVIANWERLFFLNRLYQNHIPEVLFSPPAHWRGPVQVGGTGNPCLIYYVPDIP